MSLQIYKASAGSGKTFRLSLNFIKLVLHNADSYQNILAVTFTNAATKEMKNRVIGDLYMLYKLPNSDKSKGLRSALLSELNLDKVIVNGIGGTRSEENPYKLPNGEKWTDELIKQRAGKALQKILHGYSLFHIETIDSFFQSVLRNLMHELGISALLGIELDQKEQASMAVDILYDDIKVKDNLRNALVRFSINKNEDGKVGIIDLKLKKLGELILKEDFQSSVNINSYADIFDLIKKYSETLKEEIKTIEKELSNFWTKECFPIVGDLDTFKKNFGYQYISKIYDFLFGFSTGDIEFSVKSSVQNVIDGKKALEQLGIIDPNIIISLLIKGKNLLDTKKKDYHTAKLILSQIEEIAFVYDIYLNIQKNIKLNGKFLLSDTPILLRKLINPNTAPFIFEKIGARFEHIMIDEFQDTSAIQWQNFVPLLLETLCNRASNSMDGGQTLIVGDPKQSIYRWRSGDWRLIENIGDGDGLKHYVSEETMKDNYRSSKNVVAFNNMLYQSISANIDNIAAFKDIKAPDFIKYKSAIKGIYEKASQNCKKESALGYVSVVQLPKGKSSSIFNNAALERLVKDVIECQKNGVGINDIAILLRTNRQMPLIANYFANYALSEEYQEIKKQCEAKGITIDLKLISNEAYKLSSSLAVCTIIDAIRYIVTPESDMSAKTILAVDYESLVQDMDLNTLLEKDGLQPSDKFTEICKELRSMEMKPLYELVEMIYYMLDLSKIKGQDAYLYTFLDKVQDYMKNYGSDLNLFLKRWDEKLSGESVSFSKGDGIRLVTIHKSKGLEYDTVFVPFCNWDVEDTGGNKAPVLWCGEKDVDSDVSSESKDKFIVESMSVLPIQYGKDMKNSIFSDTYNMEKMMMWIDNINLLYVATTRAINNLFVYIEQPPKTSPSTDGLGNISRYVRDALTFDENLECKVGDSIYKSMKQSKQSNENRLSQTTKNIDSDYHSYPQNTEFRQSRESDIFVDENTLSDESKEEKDFSPIDYGKLLHYVFSKIVTLSDVDRAIDEAVMMGVDVDREKLKATIMKKLENPEFKAWFAPGLKLMNERAIGYYDEEGRFRTKRPDRVIVTEKSAIIIDYKTGKENPKYNVQLKNYALLLKEMGYEEVSAYIWYLNNDKKVVVA